MRRPEVLVGRRGCDVFLACLVRDVIPVRCRWAELGRDTDAIGRVQLPELRKQHRRRPAVAHNVMGSEDELVALRGFSDDERAEQRTLGEIERRLALPLQ